MNGNRRTHSYIPKLKRQLKEGRVERREFLRTACLLGLSAPVAYAAAGKILGQSLIDPAMAQEEGQKGGTLRVAMQVQKVDDPGVFSWVEMSNQARHTLEYLTITGPDNVTRPMLAESWEPNEDLTVWTIKLREDVTWHNGDRFNVEDVKFNVERWLDPALASPNRGWSTFAAMLESGDEAKMREGAFEVVDDFTFKLNLSKPVLSVPEDFYNYPCAIVHRGFEPPFSDNPIGTGPYTMAELEVGNRCVLRRVTETTNGEPWTYWGEEPYLDEIAYFNFDTDNMVLAFASGDVDTIYQFGIEQYALAQSLPGRILEVATAQAPCARMQITEKPFDDIRVRQAVIKSVDYASFVDFVFQGNGLVGGNYHVAEVQPDHYPLPPPERDVEGAKALLAEAGYPDGIDLTIDVGNTDGAWHQTMAELMRDQMQDAGIRLNINVMPPSKYWEIWDKTPFGLTSWTHRPLGTMVLSVGYRSGVPWNETNYSNPEFDAALDEAEATYDIEKRQEVMQRVEQILQDDAVMVQPLFRPLFTLAAERVHNLEIHPTTYHQFNKVWVEQA